MRILALLLGSILDASSERVVLDLGVVSGGRGLNDLPGSQRPPGSQRSRATLAALFSSCQTLAHGILPLPLGALWRWAVCSATIMCALWPNAIRSVYTSYCIADGSLMHSSGPVFNAKQKSLQKSET